MFNQQHLHPCRVILQLCGLFPLWIRSQCHHTWPSGTNALSNEVEGIAQPRVALRGNSVSKGVIWKMLDTSLLYPYWVLQKSLPNFIVATKRQEIDGCWLSRRSVSNDNLGVAATFLPILPCAEMRAMTRHNLLTLVLQNVQELVTVLHFPPILVSRLQVNQGGL